MVLSINHIIIAVVLLLGGGYFFFTKADNAATQRQVTKVLEKAQKEQALKEKEKAKADLLNQQKTALTYFKDKAVVTSENDKLVKLDLQNLLINDDLLNKLKLLDLEYLTEINLSNTQFPAKTFEAIRNTPRLIKVIADNSSFDDSYFPDLRSSLKYLFFLSIENTKISKKALTAYINGNLSIKEIYVSGTEIEEPHKISFKFITGEKRSEIDPYTVYRKVYSKYHYLAKEKYLGYKLIFNSDSKSFKRMIELIKDTPVSRLKSSKKGMNDEAFQSLVTFKDHLKVIALYQTAVNNDGYKAFKSLTQITNINTRYNNPFNKDSLIALNSCKGLKNIFSQIDSTIDNEALKSFEDKKNLERVVLLGKKNETEKGSYDDEALKNFENKSNLKTLVLENGKIKGSGLSYLTKHKSIVSLVLTNNEIHNGIEFIEELENLQFLKLRNNPLGKNTKLTKENIHLVTLDLSYTGIGDNIENIIKKVPNIKSLVIAGESLSDKTLSKISQLNQLRYLDISDSKVNENAVIELVRNSPSLSNIELKGIEWFDKNPIEFKKTLKQHKPRIYLNGGSLSASFTGYQIYKDIRKLKLSPH